jgi:lipid-A-disaccharide synthase
MSEVKKLLPLFHKTVDVLQSLSGQDYEYVIPTVETTDEYIRNDIKSWKHKPKLVKSDNRYDVYANTYIAVVASGTVSAELAIMHIPTIVVYKMNPLTSLFAHILVRVNWVSLVNILMNKTIFPELLGRKAKYQEIVKHIQYLTIPKNRAKMIKELTSADSLWTNNGKNAAKTIADDILHSF